MTDSLWTKNFLLCIGTNFFLSFNHYLLMTTVAIFAIQQFNASASSAGMAASIFFLGSIISRLFAGSLLNKFGAKKVMYISLAFHLVFAFFYFFTPTLWILCLVRCLQGATFGIASTAVNTTVMQSLPDHRKGEGTGYFSLSATIATAIGPFAGIYVSNHFNQQGLITFASIVSGLALLCAILVTAKVKSTQTTTEPIQEKTSFFKLDQLITKEVLPFASLTFFIGVCYASIISFINLYAIQINLVSAASYFFSVFALFLLISRPIAGKVLDTKGDNIVVYPAIISFMIGMFCLSFSHTPLMLFIASAFCAIGFGTYISSIQVIGVRRVSTQRMGGAIATFYMGLDIGIAVGPILLGLIISHSGYRIMYATLGFILIFVIFLYYKIHGRYQKASSTLQNS